MINSTPSVVSGDLLLVLATSLTLIGITFLIYGIVANKTMKLIRKIKIAIRNFFYPPFYKVSPRHDEDLEQWAARKH